MNAPMSILMCSLVIISVALNGVHSKCDKVFEKGVTKSEQKNIVKKHNQIRLLIAQGKVKGQPRGINLKRMKWDKPLAQAAQTIADNCLFKHRKVRDKRFYVGQNLYMSQSSVFKRGTDWNHAIDSWFDEHKIYTYPHMGSSGHYTQVVWANTKYVGCGYTYFKQKGMRTKLYVCNYGPGGNVASKPPYKIGKSGCDKLC